MHSVYPRTWSRPALIKQLYSFEWAILVTLRLWPLSTCLHSSISTSHIFSVASADAEINTPSSALDRINKAHVARIPSNKEHLRGLQLWSSAPPSRCLLVGRPLEHALSYLEVSFTRSMEKLCNKIIVSLFAANFGESDQIPKLDCAFYASAEKMTH